MGPRSLAEMLERGVRFEPTRAATIVVACCRMLDRSDPRGVIAPSRIQIAADGEVTIGEFKPEAADLGYVSPEEIDAVIGNSMGARSSGIAHPRADRPSFGGEAAVVFALGVILWEMLAARPLFRGETDYGTLLLAREAIVPAVKAPPALAAIMRKALAPDADDRYPTVQAMVDVLERYLTG